MASAVLLLFSTIIVICVLRWLLKTFYFDKQTIGGVAEKYVLVTGSGSGFGKEIVIRLEKLGFNVFATCRTTAGEEAVSEVCSSRVRTYCMDVTDPEQVQHVFEKIRNEIPADVGLWGLVNNAGKLTVGSIEWQPLDSFRSTADVNLWGMIRVTKTFLPLIKKARGRVVNMGSILGRIVLPFLPAYCISKYGVEAFSDALRREMLPWGVGVSIIEAGAHRTKLLSGQHLADQWKSLWDELSEDMKHEYGEEVLQEGLKRLMLFDTFTSPHIYKVVDDVIHALTCCNTQACYVTGLDAKLLAWLSLMPAFITDLLLRLVSLKPKRDEKENGTMPAQSHFNTE